MLLSCAFQVTRVGHVEEDFAGQFLRGENNSEEEHATGRGEGTRLAVSEELEYVPVGRGHEGFSGVVERGGEKGGEEARKWERVELRRAVARSHLVPSTASCRTCKSSHSKQGPR